MTSRRFLHPPRTSGRSISQSWGLEEPEYQVHAPPSGADFIYGVCRNPWDRVVSLWCWMHEGKSGWDMPFDRWVRNGMEPNFTTGSGFKIIRPCSWWLHPLRAGVWKDRPDIVAERGLRDADFVIRYERREEDLETLARMLDRPFPARYVGKSDRLPYREYYDEQTAALVGEAFAEDVEMYGYEFGA